MGNKSFNTFVISCTYSNTRVPISYDSFTIEVPFLNSIVTLDNVKKNGKASNAVIVAMFLNGNCCWGRVLYCNAWRNSAASSSVNETLLLGNRRTKCSQKCISCLTHRLFYRQNISRRGLDYMNNAAVPTSSTQRTWQNLEQCLS